MNESTAAKLQATLTDLYPDAEYITVRAEEDGAQVSIKIGGVSNHFSFGDDDSSLLRYLITGSPVEPKVR